MRLLQNGKETAAIDFGMVELGTRKEIIVELENNGEGTLTDLIFKIDFDVQIIDAPKTVNPHATVPIRLSWAPTPELRQPLEVTLEVTGKEVFRG